MTLCCKGLTVTLALEAALIAHKERGEAAETDRIKYLKTLKALLFVLFFFSFTQSTFRLQAQGCRDAVHQMHVIFAGSIALALVHPIAAFSGEWLSHSRHLKPPASAPSQRSPVVLQRTVRNGSTRLQSQVLRFPSMSSFAYEAMADELIVAGSDRPKH